MAVVLSLNALAALITMKAGLVIKSCAFRTPFSCMLRIHCQAMDKPKPLI